MIVFEVYTCNFYLPKRLANCKLYTLHWSAHPYKQFPFNILHFTKKTHRKFGDPQCRKLCVKEGPASLKSLCVNKLAEFTTYIAEIGQNSFGQTIPSARAYLQRSFTFQRCFPVP